MKRSRMSSLNGYYALRWRILERDNFTCQCCGQSAPNVRLEVDHIIPVAEGGTDDETNLRTTCYACNRGRNALAAMLRRRVAARAAKGLPIESMESNPWRQNAVVELLQKHPGGLSITEVAHHLDLNVAYIKVLLRRVLRNKRIVQTGRGVYAVEQTARR